MLLRGATDAVLLAPFETEMFEVIEARSAGDDVRSGSG
jgi:hypothetical protein